MSKFPIKRADQADNDSDAVLPVAEDEGDVTEAKTRANQDKHPTRVAIRRASNRVRNAGAKSL